MADTERTLAALQLLLANNGTGDISAQDLRDMLVSVGNGKTQQNSAGWKDNVMPLTSDGVPKGETPKIESFGSSGLREEMVFDVADYVFVDPLHVNHDIKINGDCYLHVHWSTNGTDINTVKWEFQVLRALRDTGQFSTLNSYTVEQAGAGAAWNHNVAEVLDADKLTLTEPDELILVTLRRLTNGTGTENNDKIFGLTVDMHYESDRDSTLNKASNFYA